MKKEEIEKLKVKYGKIFKITIEGREYIYRKLNLGEILSIQTIKDEVKLSIHILNCVLYPACTDNISPGDYLILKDTLLEAIEIKTDEDLIKSINFARQRVDVYMQNLFFNWKLHIIKTFPCYKFEDIDKLQIEDFMDLLLLSENITGINITNYKPNIIKNKNIDADGGIIKTEKINDGSSTKRNPIFLSREELDRIAIEKSTKELENVYFGKITPTHQEGEQIKNKNWKDVDIPQSSKKKPTIPTIDLAKK